MIYKQYIRKHFYWLLVIVLLLSSCSASESTDYIDSDIAQGSFDDFCNETFKETISSNLLTMHYLIANPKDYGIEDYKVILGDHTTDSDINKAYLTEYKNELNRYRYNDLTASQQITYDIFSAFLDTEFSGSDYGYYFDPINSTNGEQILLPILLAEYEFYSQKDIDEYLELLSTYRVYFEGLIEYEKRRAEKGFFMGDYTLEKVIAQCEDFVKEPESNLLITIFNDKINNFAGLTETQMNDYKTRNNDIVLTTVLPTYKYLSSELTKLSGSSNYSGGVCNLPDGKDYYKYLVKSYTGSDKSIGDIIELVETQLSDNFKTITSLCLLDYESVISAADYRYGITDPKELTEHFIEASQSDFPEIPKVDYEIKSVHQSLEEYLNPALYIKSPLDLPSQNVIYINNNEKYSQQNSYATIAHEGYPGHLYQHQYLNTTDLCSLRKLLNFNGYSEGWATYIETIAYDYCDADDITKAALSLNGSYSLGIYSYLDLMINYEGWTYEQAKDYLAAKSITDEETCRDIYMALVEQPAVYLQYYIGYLEIISLRDKAMEELGNQFILKDFHEFILNFGPAQFYIIDKYMDEWIEEQLNP